MSEKGIAVPEPATLPHWYSPDSDPLTLTDGDGAWVYDEDGDRYLDFMSQLYCVNAGHGNETIVERMTDQLGRVQYVSSAKHNDARTKLAGKLAERAPAGLTDVMFSVTGSEANEAAIQLARSYQDAPKVLTRWQSYHGATYAAGALSGDPDTRNAVEQHAATTGHGKFLPPLHEAFGTDSEAELAERAADHLEFVVKNEGPSSVAAILMEPVGGTSGAYTAPEGYFERVREVCDEYDILLVADEVITGFGRCGEWFGIQTEGVRPDMITFAKGCTSAYVPLAGVITRPDIGEHFREEGIRVGQTFGGHPVACAAGLGAIEAYEDGLLENVRELAPYLEDRLEAVADSHDVVGEVRGRGFHWAVTFRDPDTGEPFVHPWTDPDADNPVAEVRELAKEHGALFGSGRPDTQVIVSPPFTVDREQVETGVAALEDAVSAVFG